MPGSGTRLRTAILVVAIPVKSQLKLQRASSFAEERVLGYSLKRAVTDICCAVKLANSLQRSADGGFVLSTLAYLKLTERLQVMVRFALAVLLISDTLEEFCLQGKHCQFYAGICMVLALIAADHGVREPLVTRRGWIHKVC